MFSFDMTLPIAMALVIQLILFLSRVTFLIVVVFLTKREVENARQREPVAFAWYS